MPSPTDPMEFRVLGPFEVFESGQALEIGAGKQRALLAVLLLRSGEVVSTDRLIDALWDETRPRAPSTASTSTSPSSARRSVTAIWRRGGMGTCSRSSPSSWTSGVSSACSAKVGSSSPTARPSRQRRPCVPRSPSGAGRRSRTSRRNPSHRVRSLASRSCAWPPSRRGSRPTSPSTATPSSSLSSRSLSASIRCGSVCKRSSCSPSTALAARRRRSAHTGRRAGCSQRSSVSNLAGDCRSSKARS